MRKYLFLAAEALADVLEDFAGKIRAFLNEGVAAWVFSIIAAIWMTVITDLRFDPTTTGKGAIVIGYGIYLLTKLAFIWAISFFIAYIFHVRSKIRSWDRYETILLQTVPFVAVVLLFLHIKAFG